MSGAAAAWVPASCNSLLQARLSCRLASHPGSVHLRDRSLPPTGSPCAAAAQAAWPPTRLLRRAPRQPPPLPPPLRLVAAAFCVDSADAWRLRGGRSATPLATNVVGRAAAACIL